MQPGVYDWIEIISGNVTFAPGIYIITGANPLTGVGLSILGGTVTANGVLFYITNSTSFDPSSGTRTTPTAARHRPAAGCCSFQAS